MALLRSPVRRRGSGGGDLCTEQLVAKALRLPPAPRQTSQTPPPSSPLTPRPPPQTPPTRGLPPRARRLLTRRWTFTNQHQPTVNPHQGALKCFGLTQLVGCGRSVAPRTWRAR